jgi:predicted nucleic acid-binding Zn ribbon protein
MGNYLKCKNIKGKWVAVTVRETYCTNCYHIQTDEKTCCKRCRGLLSDDDSMVYKIKHDLPFPLIVVV